MEERSSISAALLPQHLEATTYFAQVLPASHHPDEIDRAIKIAGLTSMVPIEKLDSTWAIQALGREVRHLQSRLEQRDTASGTTPSWSAVAWRSLLRSA